MYYTYSILNYIQENYLKVMLWETYSTFWVEHAVEEHVPQWAAAWTGKGHLHFPIDLSLTTLDLIFQERVATT